MSNPEFYGDLVLNYKFNEIITSLVFFFNLLTCLKKVGNNINIRQTACIVFNQIMVDSYAALFSYTAVVQVSVSI